MKSLRRLKLWGIVKPYGKYGFVRKMVPFGGRLLDAGCGDSPPLFKRLRPDIYYVGLDVCEYNGAGGAQCADEYIICNPEEFAGMIGSRECEFDAVISCHNIEHCDDPWGTLEAMVKSLKPGGLLYIATPDVASVGFPRNRRHESLNFYGDSTHKEPLRFEDVINRLSAISMSKIRYIKRYRPIILFIFGLLYEPIARLTNRGTPFLGSWALYGFEDVYIAKKNI